MAKVFDRVGRGGQVTGPAGLTGADLHVWHGVVDVETGTPGEPPVSGLAILDAGERAHCRRFVRRADRVRFAATHAARRRLLACYLEVDPSSIRFGRSPCCECGSAEHGPPVIGWPPTDITFNFSGSGDHWLLAVTRAHRVGADIEVPRDIDTGQLAACLTTAEQQDLTNQPAGARLQMFYRCWTRKEAVLKACGIGLRGALGGLAVAPGHSGPVEVRHTCKAGPDVWAVRDLAAEPGPAGGEGTAGTPGWLGAVAQPAAAGGRFWYREAASAEGGDPDTAATPD